MARKNKNAGERRKRRPPKGQRREKNLDRPLHVLDVLERRSYLNDKSQPTVGGTNESTT